ncbi:hypothetical protein PLICRDRAFT_180369 [Plicaturopsis crispa FD-325 SS-3]|uniref:Uncharacterized protein n=1 Tax=Plicaturopsis crispa FD-325 SS-3 TaxID=944288 RepID=A0A0C9SW34_PLICR|nr:hypothetical protein PLICRDRAFT_180369 [Plicaturopsis crispa FD-325 SS-3]
MESMQVTTRGLYSPAKFEEGIMWLRIFLRNLYDQKLILEPCVTVQLSHFDTSTINIASVIPPNIVSMTRLPVTSIAPPTSIYCVWDLETMTMIHVEHAVVAAYMDREAVEGYRYRTPFIPVFWERFRMDINRQRYVIVQSIVEREPGVESIMIRWAAGPILSTHIYYFHWAAPFIPAATVSLRSPMRVVRNSEDADCDSQTYVLQI